MKYINMEPYFHVEIYKDRSSPMGRWCSALTFWQIRHLSTHSAISLFMLFHHKYCLRSLYILGPPRCTEYRVLWAFTKIFFLSSLVLGTYRRFWNHKVPSSCITNTRDLPLSKFFFTLWCWRSLSWFAWISSTMAGCKVSAENWTHACPCATNWILYCSSSLRIFNCVITTVPKLCCAFLLGAYTTTFAFPKWYWIYKA